MEKENMHKSSFNNFLSDAGGNSGGLHSDMTLIGCIKFGRTDEAKAIPKEKMLQYFSNRSANFNQGKVNVREEEGKASCLTSSMASCDISDNFIKVDTNLRKAVNQDKANCFTAGGNSPELAAEAILRLLGVVGQGEQLKALLEKLLENNMCSHAGDELIEEALKGF